MKRIICLCAALVGFFAVGLIAESSMVLKVINEMAIVHSKPDISSDAIAQVKFGTLLVSSKKIGNFYEISITDKDGRTVPGFLHSSVVKILVTEEEKLIVEEEKAKEPEPKPEVKPQRVEQANSGFKRKAFSLSVSALYSLSEVGYDYKLSTPYREEQLTVYDTMKKAESVGFSAALGYFVLPNLELVGGVGVTSKELSGIAGLDLPNYYYYNDIDHAEVAANRKTSQTTLGFGLNYHPLSSGSFRPYVGTGVSYILAKVNLLKDYNYTDQYIGYYLWGVLIRADRLGLTIQDPKFEQASLNKLGFHINGGVNINLGPSIALYLEGKYIFAKATTPHPFSTAAGKSEDIEINLGGAALNFGIKLFF